MNNCCMFSFSSQSYLSMLRTRSCNSTLASSSNLCISFHYVCLDSSFHLLILRSCRSRYLLVSFCFANATSFVYRFFQLVVVNSFVFACVAIDIHSIHSRMMMSQMTNFEFECNCIAICIFCTQSTQDIKVNTRRIAHNTVIHDKSVI